MANYRSVVKPALENATPPHGEKMPRVVEKPRISAAKLAEYMVATFTRKRQILETQKYPPGYMFSGWLEANKAVSVFAANGHSDTKPLDLVIRQLKGSDHNHAAALIADLEDAKAMGNSWPFNSYEMTTLEKNLGPVLVSGVQVVVNPHVILARVDDQTSEEKRVGCVKFNFPKSHPLIGESAAYLSVLLHWYAEEKLLHEGTADIRMCYAVDLPSRTVFDPLRSYKRRRTDLRAACRDIADLWDSLEDKRKP